MSQNQKSQFWLNGRWEYLDAENANNLDALDSTDFASQGQGLRAINNAYFLLGNNDWTSLIDGEHSYCTYKNSYKGVAITGQSRSIKIKTRIPIDPLMSYEVSVRVKRIAGTGSFYCGVETLDNSFSPVRTDNATTYNYGVANAAILSNGTATTFTGVFKGFNEPAESSHNKFDPYGSYFDIIILTDNGATDSSGYYIIESLSIKEYIPLATPAVNGLMSAADKTKLNSLNNYTHPNDVNTRHVSEAEKSSWNSKANGSHTHDYAPTNHTHTIANISGLQAELDNLKSLVGNGKNLIASAITEKGISASGSESFESLSNKIKQITTAPFFSSSGETFITGSSSHPLGKFVEGCFEHNLAGRTGKIKIVITPSQSSGNEKLIIHIASGTYDNLVYNGMLSDIPIVNGKHIIERSYSQYVAMNLSTTLTSDRGKGISFTYDIT